MKLLDNGIFEENYKTSFSQNGIHGELTNKSFLSLFENLAGTHSAYCHFTFSDLEKDHLSWVILSWKLRVYKRPKADQDILVQTWGRFSNKVFVLRDFKVLDKEGNVLAIASSKWCLVDSVQGRIAKMPDNLAEIYYKFYDESVFGITDLPRLQVPETKAISSDTYKIRRFDLDLNKHVHNLNYLNFAYEVLPLDVFIAPELNNVEISYKKEIKYGETIKSSLYIVDGKYVIVIRNEDESLIHAIITLE